MCHDTLLNTTRYMPLTKNKLSNTLNPQIIDDPHLEAKFFTYEQPSIQFPTDIQAYDSHD